MKFVIGCSFEEETIGNYESSVTPEAKYILVAYIKSLQQETEDSTFSIDWK